jgi:NAD+ kinase
MTTTNDFKFKRIILYARQYRASSGVRETLVKLISFLEALKLEVLLDDETSSGFDLDYPILPKDLNNTASLIVVVGGDGSLLSAARMAVNFDIPVIGVNRGNLGFLTDISPYSMEQELLAVLTGVYKEEKRSLINVSVFKQGELIFTNDALNDVVLSSGMGTRLISFGVYVDKQFVSQYRSDGLILATPTGSTAYALSAGGPIMHPQLAAISIVPMFSHSLNSRPLVVHNNSVIELNIAENSNCPLQLSADGQESFEVLADYHIVVKKSLQDLKLLHHIDYSYYDTLRIKLGWGSDS